MNQRLPLIVAGCLFSVVAIIHALRLYFNWEIEISGLVIPMSVSVLGLVIMAVLALWMFMAAKKG